MVLLGMSVTPLILQLLDNNSHSLTVSKSFKFHSIPTSGRFLSSDLLLSHICRSFLGTVLMSCLVYQLRLHLFLRFAQDTIVVTSDYFMMFIVI